MSFRGISLQWPLAISSGSAGWHLCVVWSQGQPPLQKEKGGNWWFSLVDNGCFPDVRWMRLREGSAISVP